jgi:flagellar motor protein MotB
MRHSRICRWILHVDKHASLTPRTAAEVAAARKIATEQAAKIADKATAAEVAAAKTAAAATIAATKAAEAEQAAAAAEAAAPTEAAAAEKIATEKSAEAEQAAAAVAEAATAEPLIPKAITCPLGGDYIGPPCPRKLSGREATCPLAKLTVGKSHIEGFWRYLDTLETRISLLLAFQGAASITTILFSTHPSKWRSPLVLLLLLWFLATSLCLWASRRIVWGDLSENSQAAVDYLVAKLAETIVDRTAKFRVAVDITVVYVVLAALLMGKVIFASASPTPAASPTPVHSDRPYWIDSFFPGLGCASNERIRDKLTEVATNIQRDHAKDIKIVGFADSMPIRRSKRAAFEDNPHLALSRGRCVAGWLQEMLSERAYKIDKVQISDVVDPRKHRSDPDYRRVSIAW